MFGNGDKKCVWYLNMKKEDNKIDQPPEGLIAKKNDDRSTK